MGPSACLVCGGLDVDEISKLMVNAGTWGRVPYHWMSSDELRASAAGTVGNIHLGAQKASPKHCKTCTLLRDAVESFFQGSGLVTTDVSALDYAVALQNPTSGAPRKSLKSGKKRNENDCNVKARGEAGKEGKSREKSKEQDKDNAYLSDGGESADSWRSVEASSGEPSPAGLRLLVRCNLTPPKAVAQDGDDEEFQLELFTTGKSPFSTFPMIGPAGEVFPDLKAEDYGKTIRHWRHLCDTTHQMCYSRTEAQASKSMPKRVLKIANTKISLFETATMREPYVTLSHCWGSQKQVPVTIRENIVERMKDIPFDTLPRSFQDAIQVSRAIGIQYLWIDSLCIIQDDVKDWQEQTARMKDIYENCYLNIAAARVSGGRDGFLGSRWSTQDTWAWTQTTNTKLDIKTPAKPKSKVRKLQARSYAVLNKKEPGLYENGFHDHGLRVRLALKYPYEPFSCTQMHSKTAPLNQRAWVFQEELLAPRTVHFHEDEMTWQCYSGDHCECTAQGEMWEYQQFEDLQHICKNTLAINSWASQDLQHVWRRAVEDYTALNLSYETDRLPALAGLACWMQDILSSRFPKSDEEYLAGLWKSSLGRNLLWEHEVDPKIPRRLDVGDKTPPTWSWASLAYGNQKSGIKYVWEGATGMPVSEFTTYSQDQRFSVKSASISALGPSPYGHVSGGSITVTGAMCAIALVKDTAPIPQIWRDQIPIRSKDSFNSLQLRYDDPRDAEEVLSQGNPTRGLIFCLFIGTFIHKYSLDHEDHPSRKGLILKPSKKVPGAAERIGCWTQFVEKWAVGTDVFPSKQTAVSVTIV